MVQFLSINFFFLDFFHFCWVFQKSPFFVSPVQAVTVYKQTAYRPSEVTVCDISRALLTFIGILSV